MVWKHLATFKKGNPPPLPLHLHPRQLYTYADVRVEPLRAAVRSYGK